MVFQGVAAAIVAASFATVVRATDVLHNGAWSDGQNCIDHANNADYAYVYQCHYQANQQWSLTSDDQLRTAQGNCMEMFDDNDRVAIVPCDAGRRQKWYVTDGLIKPQGFRLNNGTWSMRVGYCLDASQPNGKLTIFGCHGALNQKFSASFLPTVREDVVQITGPWRKGANCLDYDFSNGVAYIYECHGQWNQRWRSTKTEELRVSADKCLEYDASTSLVFVRTCTGAASQQWVVRDDKLLQAKAAANQCLSAPYPTSKLSLATCDASKATQQFTSPAVKSKIRDLLKVDGPQKDTLNCVDYAWGTEVAYVYGCHGEANQLWEFTADEQIRTTADNKCLEFDGEGLEKVYARPCNAQLATQKWKIKGSREIVTRGYFTSGGVWRSTSKCLDVALEDAKLHLWDCTGGNNQKFQSEVFPVRNRDYVFADGAAATGSNCLRASNGLVSIAKCSASPEMLWEYLPANGTMRVQLGSADGSNDECLTADLANLKLTVAKCAGLTTQRWERTANGEVALQANAQAWDMCIAWTSTQAPALGKCSAKGPSSSTAQKISSVIFDGVSASTSELTPLFESANDLAAAVKTDLFLTANVLERATKVVTKAAAVLSSAAPSNVQRAKEFLTQFLTKSENVAKPLVKTRALYLTSESEEFLLMLSVLLQGDAAQAVSVLAAIEPALTTFSDQLLEARYDVLLDHVLQNDTNRLEAYTDGTLSDFDQVGGILSAVCEMSATAKAKNLAMCRLSSYFTLIDQFFVLKYKLLADGARGITQTTRDQASKVAKIFADNQTQFQKDPLWTRLMTLLVFGSAYVDVLPSSMLAKASQSHAYLPTFVLYAALGTNPTYLAAVDPMVRFLSDQITTFHVNNILTIVTDQDTDALEAYLAEPFMGFRAAAVNMSDFPTMALYVAPLVCSDESRLEPLSLCRLQEFHSGLQSVLNFERARRSDDVSLVDLLGVDVRKKMDVLDAEKKQYEALSTLQNVANQIGATLIQGLTDLKKQIAASTAAIRSDIEKSRQDLRAAIGTVGATLQDAIQTSTQTITKEVGEKAAAIRSDIYESTRQLTERLDDTGRAILGSIEQSKQELKYQIGAEAQQTRKLISEKTDELKTHMTQETQGLREYIDVKTNQVIGVVRDESKLTRETVDKVAGQIIRVVKDEGAITRSFVDTKTNEVKDVVRAESKQTREFVDARTKDVIKVVQEEATTTRSRIDAVGNRVIEAVKSEGDETRKVVRAEGVETRKHIDEKTDEVKSVVREEGKLTRDKVTAATIELTDHVTKQTDSVKSRIDQAQSSILEKSDKQFESLSGQVNGVSSSLKDIRTAVSTSTSLVADMSLGECQTFDSASLSFDKARAAYLSAVAEFIDDFDALDDGYYIEHTDYHMNNFVSHLLQWLQQLYQGDVPTPEGPDEEEPNYYFKLTDDDKEDDDFESDVAALEDLFETFDIVTDEEPEWDVVKQLIHNPKTKITNFKIPYQKYLLDYRLTEILRIFDYVRSDQNYFCNCNGGAVSEKIDRIQKHITNIHAAMDSMRQVLISAVAVGAKCNSAKKAKVWASSSKSKSRLRALQAASANPNEPYYAMIYSSLAKIILDYRIQEAAFQFCKYYEFKNGGVAPPMCGSASDTKIHYTMSQIQDMRSWQPIAQRRLTTRLLLPTQPMTQPGTRRQYPFVDLRTLQSGGSVLFTVPTWDLNWLKKYSWVLTNTKEETFPSYYVESIRLYLPVQTNDTTGGAASSKFALTVTMESMPQQFASYASRNRKYKLPIQSFAFDTTYGQPYCVDSNKATNPYHAAAECVVTSNRVSEVCVLNNGAVTADTQRMLLPSLFATWRISADFDRADRFYQLVQPVAKAANSTEGVPELNLFADVTLLQATTMKSTASIQDVNAITATAPSTCCGPSEYKPPQGQCAKCPVGYKSALNGYTCSA